MIFSNQIVTSASKRIAYFISSHGYGHAARAAAIMAAVQRRDPDIYFDIFTEVPDWFFRESLTGPFGYHPLLTDIGLVQKDSLNEDLPQTIRRLNEFLPFDQDQLKALAHRLRTFRPACRLVICDIAPLGIAVAHETGIPAVLVENFTWDWIYQGYPDYQAALAPHISYLHEWFQSADYHIQTEPICAPQTIDLATGPVSRSLRVPPAEVRQKLGAPEGAKLVALSMGGLSWDYTFLKKLKAEAGLYFVIAGSEQQFDGLKNVIPLARDSGIFHPDLINACDAIIGKVGYSTLAEVYQAGLPFGYIARPAFRESPVLVDYIETKIGGLPFTVDDLQEGSWLEKLPALLALPRRSRPQTNGADQVAEFICNHSLADSRQPAGN